MVTQHEYTKCQRILHFKRLILYYVNFTSISKEKENKRSKGIMTVSHDIDKIIIIIQLISGVWLFGTPWNAARQASLSFTISQSLLKCMSVESMMPSNHLCCLFILLPWIFPSIRGFSNESSLCIKWPEYGSFCFNISPFNVCSWLISFRIDWFDPLAVQGTLKSLLQHHSSKASILWCSAFFIVQLSHPYMTIRKTIVLTIQTFVGKVMSLLFNMLSGFVIAFLPRSRRLLISWLQSPSAVILEPKKIKSFTVSIVSPSIAMKWWDWMPWSLFLNAKF